MNLPDDSSLPETGPEKEPGLSWDRAELRQEAGRVEQPTATSYGLSLELAAFTLWVRFHASEGADTVPLLSLSGHENPFHLRLYSERSEDRHSLNVEIVTAFRDGPLRLRSPLPALNGSDLHDVMVRSLGYRVELYLDGVLADEEWPVGLAGVVTPATLLIGEAASQTNSTSPNDALPEQVRLWNRALSDEEIVASFGGGAEVQHRERELLGPETPVGQYWNPCGHNTAVGDCMPFYDGKRYHLFYLFDRRGHGSKWGFGAHQWAHASSKDLQAWEHHPMAVPITDEREGSICTGSVLLHDGIYHAFYTVRTVDGSPAPLGRSVSPDGIHFEKQPTLLTLPPPYNGPSARDPFVFRDPDGGRFHMLLTTSLLSADAPPRGCLAHLVSDDLEDWTLMEPFLVPDLPGEPECPEWFEWNGRYYLVFSIEGLARYRMASGPMGPWIAPADDTFGEGPVINVMKSAPYPDNRRIGAGFLRQPGAYGGPVVFREILQQPDGTLATSWPAEMVPDAELKR